MKREQAEALIAAERVRQVEVEGWSAEHDDGHADGSLLAVARFYYCNVAGIDIGCGQTHPLELDECGVPYSFPWDAEWWKPKTPVRDLVRAGALCIAETERRLRLPSPQRVLYPVERLLERIIAALEQLDHPSSS